MNNKTSPTFRDLTSRAIRPAFVAANKVGGGLVISLGGHPHMTFGRTDGDECDFKMMYRGASGQTNQFFGRNIKTETRTLEKAEISNETETASFGRNTLFWLTFWPNICCQNSFFLAKLSVLDEKGFGRKPKRRNRNIFWPKPNRNCYGLSTNIHALNIGYSTYRIL